ncbi:hypothetical protein V1506DRAFT_159955 [Lipomyces tetrasporus]
MIYSTDQNIDAYALVKPCLDALTGDNQGISVFCEPKLDDVAAFAVLDKAVELGCTFWDTARISNNNEQVMGRWFAKTGKRSDVFLSLPAHEVRHQA